MSTMKKCNFYVIAARTLFILCLLVLLCTGSCSKEKPKVQKMADLELPVTVTAKMSTDRIVSDNILDINFEWKLTSATTAIAKNYKVMLHFMDQNNELLFVDDHNPVIPTSQWKLNEPVSYSRPVYIPFSVEEKNVSIMIGLYDEKNKQTKIGLQGMQTVYKPGRYVLSSLTILPNNDFTLDTERMELKEGWYNLERDVRNRLQWRWTKEHAVCSLRNPKKQAVLFIRGWAPYFETPAHIEFILNGHILESFAASDEFIKKYTIEKDMLGDKEWVDLLLRTDKVTDPEKTGQTSDPRKLGIMVKRIFFR